MPTFEFTSPDGKTYEIQAPEGATEAQAFEVLQTQIGSIEPVSNDMPDDMLPNIEATGLEPIVIPEAKPDPTLGEELIGAGEAALTTATGATSGLAGYLGGAGKGMAEQVLSGEFGTPQAAEAIKQAATEGAQALTYAPRTPAGQRDVEAIGAVGEALTPLSPALAEIGAVARMAKPAAAQAREIAAPVVDPIVNEAVKLWKEGTPFKRKVAEKIENDPQNVEIAKYMKKESGRIGADADAKEAIKQGFDEPVIAAIKGATDADRKNMKSMMNILKGGKKNAVYAAKYRPTDAVGESLVNRVKHINKENDKAGVRLEKSALGLKGKPVDYSDAMTNFMGELEKSGVVLERSPKGKVVPNFSRADFEGDATAERIIRKMVNRLSDTNVPDAYGVHRAKRYIDSQVSYGKQAKGLSGQAERIIKGLRHDLDSSLDSTFSAYKEANDTYGMTRQAIDNLQKAAGTSIDLKGENAGKSLGTALRRVLSNAQSRVGLTDSIAEIESVIKATGGSVNDDIITQIIFAEELDRMFGAAAKTSLKGQAEQAIKSGADIARGRGVVDIAIDTAGSIADFARGINEESAIKAIEKLLERTR